MSQAHNMPFLAPWMGRQRLVVFIRTADTPKPLATAPEGVKTICTEGDDG